jgi:hypothetical protein
VPHDLVVEQDAVAAEHVARVGGDRAGHAGVSRPASARRAICRQYSCIAVRSASIDTSRSWMIWKLASGSPNCRRSGEYRSAVS